MDKNPLSLENLDIPEFDGESIRQIKIETQKEQETYRKKYGKDWRKQYYHDVFDLGYDAKLKFVNECIYMGRIPSTMCPPGHKSRAMELFWMRAKHIYGTIEMKTLIHDEGDPTVVELLLQDAIKTGKWKELPDCLYEEYHKRVEA